MYNLFILGNTYPTYRWEAYIFSCQFSWDQKHSTGLLRDYVKNLILKVFHQKFFRVNFIIWTLLLHNTKEIYIHSSQKNLEIKKSKKAKIPLLSELLLSLSLVSFNSILLNVNKISSYWKSSIWNERFFFFLNFIHFIYNFHWYWLSILKAQVISWSWIHCRYIVYQIISLDK